MLLMMDCMHISRVVIPERLNYLKKHVIEEIYWDVVLLEIRIIMVKV